MLELFYYDLLTIVLKTSINMTYKFSNNRKIFLLGLGRKFKAIKLVISNKVYSYNNPFIFPALAFFYFVPESIFFHVIGLGRKFKVIRLVRSNKVYNYNNHFIFPGD